MTIKEIILDITNAERGNPREVNGELIDDYKLAWRELFKEAKLTAKMIQRETKRDGQIPRDVDDIMIKIIVDQWLAESTDHYLEHSHPRDDQQCGDMSCVQALAKQQETYLEDICRAYAKACRRKDEPAKKRIRKLYNEEKATSVSTDNWAWDESKANTPSSNTLPTFSSISYEHLDEPKTKKPVFIDQDLVDDAEEHIRMLEYLEDIHQEPECDPDDARFIGTPPKSDDWDDKMQSNYIDKQRGSGGVLNGLYTNTLPEPNYYTKQQRRILRRTMLASDNYGEVKLGTMMKARKMRAGSRNRLVNTLVQMNSQS
tara:strand:+ start:7703 stop:8647 length:945 start_codon:yes stop_codon:yes gene_type:complete